MKKRRRRRRGIVNGTNTQFITSNFCLNFLPLFKIPLLGH